MKPQIVNMDYAHHYMGVLVRVGTKTKPWRVLGIGKVRHFRTHAEAIHHAHKHARKGKK